MLGCDFNLGMTVRHKKMGFKGRVTSISCKRGRNWPFEHRYTIGIKEGVTESTWPPYELEIVPDEPTVEELQNKIAELKFVAEKQKEVIRKLTRERLTHIVVHVDGKEMANEWRTVKP